MNDTVGAPTEDCHDLGNLEVNLIAGSVSMLVAVNLANQELVDDVQKEEHRKVPALPGRSEVRSANQLATVITDNHQNRDPSKRPRLASSPQSAENRIVKLHHQEDLNPYHGLRQQPVPALVGIVERHICQYWRLPSPSFLGVSLRPRIKDPDKRARVKPDKPLRA